MSTFEFSAATHHDPPAPRRGRWLRAFGVAACAALSFAVHVSPASADIPVVDDAPSAASTGLGNMSVALRNSSGTIMTSAWVGDHWATWSALGGLNASSGPSLSVRPDNTVDLFARGQDRSIYHRYYTWATGWTAWGSLGGCLNSAPTAASRQATGNLDLFAIDCNGQLVFKTWTASTGWSGWSPLGGASSYKPAVISRAPNQIDVFVRDGNGSISQRHWDGATWTGWVGLGYPAGGGAYATSAPAVEMQSPGTVDLFVRDNSNNIAQRSFNGSSWSSWVTLPTSATSGPAVASEGPGRVTAFVRGGPDLYVNTFAGGAWRGWGKLITSATGGPYSTSQQFGGSDGTINTAAEDGALLQAIEASTPDGAQQLVANLSPNDRLRFVDSNGSGTSDSLTQSELDDANGGSTATPYGVVVHWTSVGWKFNNATSRRLAQYTVQGLGGIVASIICGVFGGARDAAAGDSKLVAFCGTVAGAFLSDAGKSIARRVLNENRCFEAGITWRAKPYLKIVNC